MQIGIMAGTIRRSTLEETLDAVVDYGISCMQFGLGSVGISEVPDQIDDHVCARARKAFEDRNITMAAIDGTYNMIHPDKEVRDQGLRRLGIVASTCERLGTSVITLCTGSRSRQSMWRPHPDNNAPEAWDDLVDSMEQALQVAEEYNVTLAFEPEVANTVDSAQKARRIIDQMQSPRLKVVIDGANIFHTGELPRMGAILDEAFALLAGDIVIAHAKDLDRDGEAGHLAAGTGMLDYDRYIALLNKLGFDVPIILHGLSEAQVESCVAFLREKITAANP